ncbi:6-pyruvoyl tetrahydropterin synthase family protein [Streptomyces sp. NPDC058701]|uniref:6-pyruvoyl trahydropterin synthase family protein n=1 Tax=Streptomyces sp. NPDC058701 TaxID=3346608 RepID=UPI0036562BF6
MYRIRKTFGPFSAGHHLQGLPQGHKCARPHGHNYTVEVVVVSRQLTEPGFVTDFGDLKPFGQYAKQQMDHQDLNEVFDFPPTSERIAHHLADWFIAHLEPVIDGRLEAVRVSETDATWAEYVPDRQACA